ncbi:zinc finger protein 425-like [Triplophysa dalaica]|uniref:zinc finger protein 425-like n=1 Tax=Triplophysa dalaica TaxID=1582913 RepID=UPI0024DFFDC1|nr:zinc finger protein 425-like [Triplophysa dalaica]
MYAYSFKLCNCSQPGQWQPRFKLQRTPFKLHQTPSNSGNFPPNSIKLHSKNYSSSEVQASKVNEISKHVNVGVGTETIKTEELNTEFSIEGKNLTLLKIPSPSHKPLDQLPSPSFVSNSKPAESTKTEQNVELPANVVETEAEDQDQYEEKQWTMPLDDAEIDVLIDGDQEDMDNEDNFADVAKKDSNEDEDVVIVESPDDLEMDSLCPSNGFNVHVSDEGIKRFVCAGCQRSYSRRFTMMQHLSICGARKLKQQKLFEKTSSGVPGPLRRFPCPQCGKFFSRKDNMNMHRKRCSGTIPNPPIVPSIVENKNPPAQENLFVLSPSTETPSARPESSRSSSSNWGIMSLPPVLPRRVTCECGASFTCPRLLFEHLQLHAQESYICPHCGENLQSWMDFEAHQQVHRQSQNQVVEQRGPQMHPRQFPQMTRLHVPTQQQPLPFSQVLQSHIPSGLQQPPGFQTSEINPKAQPSALLPPQKLNHSPYPETVTCYRCKKSFSGRRSLLRHLRLSCRGDAAGPKKPSVQIPSNATKPTFKPLRCPVCVRWFSCLDGLKRHLVSHSRQPTLSCQQCGQNCPSYQALEEHKRNVHKVNPGIVSANVKQEQVCKVAQSAQKNTPTDFQCHICLRYYPKLQSLKDHVRKVHRPKQPKPINLTVVDPFRSGQFQCQICMRAYPDIKSLKNHRRRVHRILGGVFQSAKGTEQNRTPDHFQCQICGSSYPDISALQNHKRTAHRVFGGLELGNHSAKPTQSVQVSNLQPS